MDFFNSQASNYLVSVAVSVNKIEKKIEKKIDSQMLVELYNSIKDGAEVIESKIQEIEQKLLEVESNDER